MKRLFISLFCTLLVAGCFRGADIPIRDLSDLPQDAGAFNDLAPETRLIPQPEQDAAYHRFLAAHFGPWTQTEPVYSAEDVFWGIRAYGSKKNVWGKYVAPFAKMDAQNEATLMHGELSFHIETGHCREQHQHACATDPSPCLLRLCQSR